MTDRSHSLLRKIVLVAALFLLVVFLFILVSNLLIVFAGERKIVPDEEKATMGADCILILGAGVREDGTPSPMLSDRLDEGIRLWRLNVAPKILVSGDHGREEYDEVNVMKNYLVAAGVPSEDVFMDHAGFSTYESICRAKEVFGVRKMVVVTQKYHLYRALYICDRLGVDAVGSPSDPRTYSGAFSRNVREIFARDKDVFTCLFRVRPTYLGDPIDIRGDGNITNDQGETT